MMKTTMIKVTAVILAMSTMLSLTGCTNAVADKLESVKNAMMQIVDGNNLIDTQKNEATEENNKQSDAERDAKYQEMIDNFVATNLNTFELSVGEAHKPQASIWLQSIFGAVYTSNPEVVQVSDLGKVTAVGAGTAYVVISWDTLYMVYRYDVHETSDAVTEEETQPTTSGNPSDTEYNHDAHIEAFVSDKLNTFSLLVGQSHRPNASVWMHGPNSSVYTSDPSVVSVSEQGEVTAVGEGIAYVLYYAGNMVRVYMYEVSGN